MADEEFKRLFQRIDTAFDEYEQGYADADATLGCGDYLLVLTESQGESPVL